MCEVFIFTRRAFTPWPLANWLGSWKDNMKAGRHKQELQGRNKTALLIIIQAFLWIPFLLLSVDILQPICRFNEFVLPGKPSASSRRLRHWQCCGKIQQTIIFLHLKSNCKKRFRMLKALGRLVTLTWPFPDVMVRNITLCAKNMCNYFVSQK